MKRASGVTMAAIVFAASAFLFGRTMLGAIRVDGLPAAAESAPALEVAQGRDQAREARQTVPDDGSTKPAEEPSALQAQAHPLASRDPAGTQAVGSPAGSSYPRVTEDEILGAVNEDLFQPDRRPPLQRYVLPSERSASTVSARDDRRRRGPELRVVGAAIMGDLGLAMVQVEDSVPLALLVGESIEGYTLAAVDAEGATLVNEDETLTLPVVEPIHPDPRVANRRSRSDANDAEALRARVQDMMRNLQQRGMQRGGGGQAEGQTITIRRGAGGQIIAPIRIAPLPGGGGGLPASFTWQPGGGELPLRPVSVSGGGRIP